jgi:hypothetical protein
MSRQLRLERHYLRLPTGVLARFSPLVIVALMATSFFFIVAILPLQGISSFDALLAQKGSHLLGVLTLLPVHLLFPGQPLAFLTPYSPKEIHISVGLAWKETALLLDIYVSTLLIYLLALRSLPARISRSFLFISTGLLGCIFLLSPVLTSSDVFSYIAYARIGVVYHQNPLATWPASIPNDPVFQYVYWANQPSAYGPVWGIITVVLQKLIGSSSLPGVIHMVLALRLLAFVAHLGSTFLIWSIGSHLQQLTGRISRQQLMFATLAFAWNPLLLFEACINAHVDATLLFFVLLALWFLVRKPFPALPSYILATIAFACAICIKINLILLAPGLLLYLWHQASTRTESIRLLGLASLTFLLTIVALYAPFWDHGNVLYLFVLNPASAHNINTLAEFAARVVSSLNAPFVNPTYIIAERITHNTTMAFYVLLYLVLCWRILLRPERIRSPLALLRWLALTWLLYCAIGSPWFWPWYLVTFFGLFALIEAANEDTTHSFIASRLPLAVCLLALTMLAGYTFYTWAPTHQRVPGLVEFYWMYLRGIWMWLLPLLAFVRLPLALRSGVSFPVRFLFLPRKRLAAQRNKV